MSERLCITYEFRRFEDGSGPQDVYFDSLKEVANWFNYMEHLRIGFDITMVRYYPNWIESVKH